MAIPTKRHERNDLTYLTKPEIEALINAPDQATWLGRRDHTLLLTMITTGVRVSELSSAPVNAITGRARRMIVPVTSPLLRCDRGIRTVI